MGITRFRQPEREVSWDWGFSGGLFAGQGKSNFTTFADRLYLHFYSSFLDVNPLFAPLFIYFF